MYISLCVSKEGLTDPIIIPYLPTVQHTFNVQFTQRYRNNRRGSRQAIAQKVFLAPAAVNINQCQSPLNDADNEEYDENIQALKKLTGKTAPYSIY